VTQSPVERISQAAQQNLDAAELEEPKEVVRLGFPAIDEASEARSQAKSLFTLTCPPALER